jgi:Lsr2
MAERIIKQLIDDLDGTEIVDGRGERVQFALREKTYAIDLHRDNVAKLENALAPFITAATKVSSRTRRRASAKGSSNGRLSRGQISAIRAWATENGYNVSSRGRIPAEIIEAFNAAH